MPSIKQTLLSATVLLGLASQAASKTCESFDLDEGDYVTTTSLRSFVVSDQVNCNEMNSGRQEPEGALSLDCNSTQCANAIPANYSVRLNTSLYHDNGEPNTPIGTLADRESIMAILSRGGAYGRVDFNTSKAYELNQVGSCMDADTAGYWGFTPFLACFYGSVGAGCEDIGEGTRVRACAPHLLSSDSRAINGAIRWVTTSGVEDGLAPESASSDDDVLLDVGRATEDGGDDGGDESVGSVPGVASSAMVITLGALFAAWVLA
ncbi:uncharacterized protein AB675_6404 [Cyphellophora attinorum]|uniref:Uncharacterized protein n=1 Tax=Cyphellophora attinorum TaxID=1664694 RepID=A0A0N1P2N4_9EURO|nr:uncharacterized protein AB675_6404 [Phialophora attinorum]KPI44125.1 hypothetical protein AB675_6404 [Phialophora attinorum]